MKKIILFISLIYLLLCISCHSKSDNNKFSDKIKYELNTTISNYIQDNNLPGAIVGIWIPGNATYVKSFGIGNIEENISRHSNDQFRIASITKTFTATIILMLVDQGLLQTSDNIEKFLPDFPNAENITIRNLLRMRSGISDYIDEEYMQNWYENPLSDYTLDEIIDLIKNKADQFDEPGQKTIYSNSNYILLAKIAESITGQNFYSLVNSNIIRALDLQNSFYPTPYEYDITGNTRGYCWEEEAGTFVDKTELNTSFAGAAGAIVSNIYDLKKYARALYMGDLLQSSTQQDRLNTMPFYGYPEFFSYGEGIFKLGNFYGHNGSIWGFSSEMWYLPQLDAVLVISINRLDLDDYGYSQDLFFKLTRIVFPEYVQW